MFKAKNSLASSIVVWLRARPQHITLFFFFPLAILFSNAQNIISLIILVIILSWSRRARRSSRLTVLVDDELLQHVLLPLLSDSVSALCDTGLSPSLVPRLSPSLAGRAWERGLEGESLGTRLRGGEPGNEA